MEVLNVNKFLWNETPQKNAKKKKKIKNVKKLAGSWEQLVASADLGASFRSTLLAFLVFVFLDFYLDIVFFFFSSSL